MQAIRDPYAHFSYPTPGAASTRLVCDRRGVGWTAVSTITQLRPIKANPMTARISFSGDPMAEVLFERAKTLMEAQLGDELVALDPEGGECFGFNGVAATVWQLLAEPRTAAAMRNELQSLYEVSPAQCESELQALLASMIERGLVRPMRLKS